MVCLLLFYTSATVFSLYHGDDMMYETRRRKPDATFLQTQGSINLPHHIGLVRGYLEWGRMGSTLDRISPVPRVRVNVNLI